MSVTIETPNNSWKPTVKQEQFLALPETVLEAFYAGAVGAGKTDVLLVYPIIRGWHENPRFKGIFFRRTFPELKNEVIPRSRDYYRPLGGEFNKNDKIWTFPSGAHIFFGHCENEDDVHNYDSMQINYAAFDELTSFTEWQYLYITLQRVRAPINSGLPAIVRSASNPGNIGHNWVRRRFIDPAPDGLKLISNPAGSKRIFIPATIDDNPHIDPKYRASLESLPQAEKQAKLYGKWDAYEGQVFEEFRDKHYPDEPDNALHVIEPFPIPEWWPRLVWGDWGYAPPAMTYVVYAAISPAGQVIVYREQSWQKVKIEDWAGYVREIIDIENPRTVGFCRSVGQDRGQEHTIQQQISSALGREIQLSDNKSGSRVAGKMLLHEYLRWKSKYTPAKFIATFNQDKAAWVLRNKGVEAYRDYLQQYQPGDPETLPKLLIFDRSPEGLPIKLLPQAIRSCIYDKSNPQDVAEFPGDDPYDTIRYVVDSADRYFVTAKDEFKKVQEQDRIIQDFNLTNDWNQLYHRSRIFEAKDKQTAVSRYRRR